MKRFYLLSLISCMMLFQGIAFAQTGKKLVKSPLQMDVKQVQSRSGESSVRLGYCDDGIVGSIGIGKTAEISGAIYITPEQAAGYKDDQIKSIHVGLSAHVTKLSVFIVKDLKGQKLAEQNVGTAAAGWKEVNLDNPYTITGEGFYVGYTCTGQNQIGMSSTFSEYGNFLGINGDWDNFATDPDFKWAALCIRAVVAGDNMPNDISLTTVKNSVSKIGESFTLTGVVESMTTVPVTSYEVEYSIDNGTAVAQTIEASFNANEMDTFHITVPAINELGEHPLQVVVTKVNGKSDDYAGNNSLQSMVRCKEYVFPYKVVVEEGTGVWCGFCPRGIVGMREMKKKYPDSFIGIGVHASNGPSQPDPMEINSYLSLLSYFEGFPSCIVNRDKDFVLDPAFGNLEKAYLDLMDEGTDAGITVAAQYTSEEQTAVRINTQTMFGFSKENAAYRIAFVVIENGVTGYSQANNFAGGGYGEMGGFENLSSRVKMDFDDVARGIYKTFTGTLNSVPATLVKGEPYTYSYELELPDNIQNKKNIEIVALLIDSATKKIVNADKIEAKDFGITGIEQTQEHADINIYAEDGRFKAAGAYDTLQVYTTEGKEIVNSGLVSGIYLVRVVTGNHIWVKKIAL